MISVNNRAQVLVNELISNFEYYRVSVIKGHNNCTIIDAGVNALGNIEAGRIISEICLGGIGRVHILNTFQDDEWPLTVHVNTNDPVIACLGSQYAGWSLSSSDKDTKFNALGSGPARSLALKALQNISSEILVFICGIFDLGLLYLPKIAAAFRNLL